VLAICEVWDVRRDLALARIVAIEHESVGECLVPRFAAVKIAEQVPGVRVRIVCFGQPGRDDLEAKDRRRTTYNLVEVSKGQLRGLVEGKDPQDNEDMGALMHDAWTYWGHSGAPLVKRADGALVGLHSSWDDETAMRHGIPWVAIREFLQERVVDLA